MNHLKTFLTVAFVVLVLYVFLIYFLVHNYAGILFGPSTSLNVSNATIGHRAVCNDTIIEPGEVCDDGNLNNKTCSDFGYANGTLACCLNCTRFDFSGCVNLTRSCTDYDNGLNDSYIKSNVSYFASYTFGQNCDSINVSTDNSESYVFDECNGSALIERMCNLDKTPGFRVDNCTYGCADGVCLSSPALSNNVTNCTDNDSDGYNITSAIYSLCGPIDCNDNNASIHPNASELCNGIDDNCNGVIDENCNYTNCSNGIKDSGETGIDCGGVCLANCSNATVPTPGNGGDNSPSSNSGDNNPACISAWECGEWEECVQNTQVRTCFDRNACNNSEDKPAESNYCGVENLGGENGQQKTQPSQNLTFAQNLRKVLAKGGESFLISLGIYALIIGGFFIVLYFAKNKRKKDSMRIALPTIGTTGSDSRRKSKQKYSGKNVFE